MVVFQVPRDRVRPGVQALPGQLLTQPGDQGNRGVRDGPGEVAGRRDRGSNAVSPSARYRATRREIHPWETPYSRATSPCERPSMTTAVMTKRAFDMHRP